MDFHVYLGVLVRLVVLHYVGSISCEYRKVQRLRPEIHQPFDYRCPCVPLDSCSHPPPRDLSPCPDVKTVRCCTSSGSRDARVYLGIEPLTTAITKDDQKAEQNVTAQMTMEKLDGEMKVDFSIDDYNNREMKSINVTNMNNTQDKKEESDKQKTNIEEKPESTTEIDTFLDNSMIDVDEMVKNSTNMDSLINLNIEKLYDNNNESEINEAPEIIIEVEINTTNIKSNSAVNVESITESLRVPNYQIVFPDDSRIRDESARKFIVYPVNTSEIDDLATTLEDVFINNTKNYSVSENLSIDELLDMKNESNTEGELYSGEDNAQEVLKTSSNEETGNVAEEETGDVAEGEIENDNDDIYSSSEILKQIKDFGRRMSLREKSQADRNGSAILNENIEEKIKGNITMEKADRRDFKVTEETMETPKGEDVHEEEEILPAASETVEQLVMPNGLEDGNKVQERVPIRLPSRDLKLQIQGTSRPKVRNHHQKRRKPLLNNNSNIREIINDQKYGAKVETPRNNARSKHRLAPGVTPSQSIQPSTGADVEYISETNQRGVFVPPSYMESGFLPMVEDEPDLKIVGPIPLGFQDRSKPNNFQTEDGIRISDLELPSFMKPPLFFNVFDQGKSNSLNDPVVGATKSDNSHPELPEQDAKDFLSNPNNEILNKSLYETTEDGVYIVQLPLPPVGEVEPFRSEETEEDEEAEEDEETSDPFEESGPVDHHNLDVELESKEDQITQFQLAQTNNRFNLKTFPQNSERFIENPNFQLQPPLLDQQNFRSNPEINTETRPNGFRKENLNKIPFLTSLEPPNQDRSNFFGFQNEQSLEPLPSVSDTTQGSQKFQLPLENNDANFRPTATKLGNRQSFVFQGVPRNQHTLALFVKTRGTNGDSSQDFSATQQLPSNNPISFTSSSTNNQNTDDSLPLTQQLPSNNRIRFTSSTTNNQNTDDSFLLTQQLPSSSSVNFLPTLNIDATSGHSNRNNKLPQRLPSDVEGKFTTQQLQQRLPSDDEGRFTTQQLPQRLPSDVEGRLTTQQLTQRLPSDVEGRFTTQQLPQRFPSVVEGTFTTQQLPQDGLAVFTEAKNKNRPKLSLFQELPQNDVTNFAGQTELPNGESVLKQSLPSEQETIFKTINHQKVFSQGLPQSSASPDFLQSSRPVPQPPNSVPRRRPNILPTQGEISSQVSPNSDSEKAKYDVALQKYKADLKIYREQYDAFLRKNFPSAIRIF